jgi:hypothetical protein
MGPTGNIGATGVTGATGNVGPMGVKAKKKIDGQLCYKNMFCEYYKTIYIYTFTYRMVGTKRDRIRLQVCVFMQIMLFIVVFVAIRCVKPDNGDITYLRFGPNEGLSVLDVKINTWTRYLFLNLFIAFLEISDTIIGDIGNPILGFTIYNPDKEEIIGFSRFEIQLYANTMWLFQGLRNVLNILVSVSQIDIACGRVLYSQFASIFTIYYLIKDKKCVSWKDENSKDTSGLENNYEVIKDIDNILEMV